MTTIRVTHQPAVYSNELDYWYRGGTFMVHKIWGPEALKCQHEGAYPTNNAGFFEVHCDGCDGKEVTKEQWEDMYTDFAEILERMNV